MGRRPSNRGKSKLPAGALPRRFAAQWLGLIRQRRRTLDELLAQAEQDEAWQALEPRDKGFARSIIMTALRHHGELSLVLGKYLTKPPQAKSGVYEILLTGAAQLLFMGLPAHAVIDVAVSLAKSSDKSRHLAKLVNAVLRRVGAEGAEVLAAEGGAGLNIPPFMQARWQAHYGAEATDAMVEVMLAEPPLDLYFPSEKESWATRLGGELLLFNAVRLAYKGAVREIEGFDDGAWWVQDFAAQLPVQLMGDVAGLYIADLCAAPGGKTAALAKAGAVVTAVDISAERVERLQENKQRLGFEAELLTADVLGLDMAGRFDAVLLDAPCSATGTIRRHPDILLTKTEEMILELAALQRAMLKKALTLLKPGGQLIYCTCSLEPEEGEQQIEAFLASGAPAARVAITPDEVAGQSHWLNAQGDVRLCPSFAADAAGEQIGMDGFFISRLKRTDGL